MPSIIIRNKLCESKFMPYIERNSGDEIIAIHRETNSSSTEQLPSNHPDVVSFLAMGGDANTPILELTESDKDIARVTEDLIQLLIAKNLINFTELPEPVQHKLLTREKLRISLQGSLVDFLDGNDTI